MLGISARATVTSVTALCLAFLLPRLGLLNTFLLAPLWISAGLAVFVAYAIATVDARHREPYIIRPLGFTTPSAWSALLIRRSWESPAPPTLSSESGFDAQVDSFMRLVKLHFIAPWYTRISPDQAFPDQVDILVRHMVEELGKRAQIVDWPSFIVSRILPILTEHLRHYRSVEHLASTSTTPMPLALPKKPHPALANTAHTFWGSSSSIEAHLRDKLERVVNGTLQDGSTVVSTMVREVLLGTIMTPVFDLLSDSDFWNRQIDDRAGKYLHEQKQVNKFLSALASLPPASPRGSGSITATSSTRQFEAFLRSIPKVRTLGEARHLRVDIEREQRAAKSALDEAIESNDELRSKIAKKYLKRLERARLEVDNRITALSGSVPTPAPAAQARPITLYSVLADPATLAPWLEFMERRKRARLVQFWLTVEGFKNPLEDASQLQAQTVRDDLLFLEQYADAMSETHLDVIRRATDTPESLAAARQAMLAAQKEVYEAMEENDWPQFRKTELFLKASTEIAKSQQAVIPPKDTSTPDSQIRPVPRLKAIRQQGSFTPVPQASTQVSTVLPTFERAADSRISISRSMSSDASRTPSLPVTPPAPRRTSQLDFLISPEEGSRARLFEEDAMEDFVQVERMEAIQAALNEIIASDNVATGRAPESMSSSLVLPKARVSPKLSSKSVEDLRSAQLIDPPRRTSHDRRHLFDDIPDEEAEDTVDDPDIGYDSPRPAAPGDLQLSVEIARLQDKITELVKQEHLLENLIRQAELVGNQHELKILQRSLSSIRREQRTTVFQKAQFEQQEEENRLVPGRTLVHIPSSVVTLDQGKQVVRYSIEVKQIDDKGGVVTGWMVARRYNEFWELDKDLRDTSLPVSAEIPPKRLVPNMSSSFIDTRRVSLERYLQSLVSQSAICESKVLQNFLSRDTVPLSEIATPQLEPQNIVRSLYRTMATSLDEAILGPSMLDVMYTSLNRQLSDIGAMMGGEELSMGALFPVLKQGWTTPSQVLESGPGSFTAPICDLFIEVFDLKGSNWLRRQAIVVLLQQFFGGTIERRCRDAYINGTSASSMERVVAMLQETIFPDGQRRVPAAARTAREKNESRNNAGQKLAMLIPDVAANMIGRGNARRAARRVFGALQDQRLNQQLFLCIFDEVSRFHSLSNV
ncbi:PXA domain-domain-containing protein [Kockovaella imperatae]|uniref:PXA domain-domain-containing protein n=1 Tax=Kockovaella imperatae TaxID=4999 RepID=A0A1Y1UDF9_9TREE|nr:PXA domain-domain-containing protein [Kockovaella imperatae]ORX36019.1 PXA domain-domain-containing protein [Kockovaella imperatae]